MTLIDSLVNGEIRGAHRLLFIQYQAFLAPDHVTNHFPALDAFTQVHHVVVFVI